jgi:NAD(P)H-nitrite reductase large subunit
MIKATGDASVEVFLRGGKIVAAILIGDVSERAAITAQIRENHFLRM